ncbi:hypothetical protein NPIL_118251 [Nephila pilipes]|uniref:C2H2-type domain-containing protein n=1 Tax=Nephila pilipes TaxID=299642 RepID=A0A8X6Q7C5_NEPPI|nr:hypothetical protein NPIL_118251 [Nephila pilipes]
MLNSYSPSNYPRKLTLKSFPCDNEQSNGSLFYPGSTSNETGSSDTQYSQPISNTSSLNSGENISHIIRNTISVSEYPRSMYQETISRNMENTNLSICILGSCSNTNNSFNLQQSQAAFYHPDSILKENDSRDMQSSSSSIYSTELRKNFNKFLETQNSRTSYLCNGSTLNKNYTKYSSLISPHTHSYGNIPINKVSEKSNENNTEIPDFEKTNDKTPEPHLKERKKIESIQMENYSWQRLSHDRIIFEKENVDRKPENKIFARRLKISNVLQKNRHKGTFDCEFCNKKFRTNAGRIYHRLTHTEEFLFSCQYCSKRFKTSTKPYQIFSELPVY